MSTINQYTQNFIAVPVFGRHQQTNLHHQPAFTFSRCWFYDISVWVDWLLQVSLCLKTKSCYPAWKHIPGCKCQNGVSQRFCDNFEIGLLFIYMFIAVWDLYKRVLIKVTRSLNISVERQFAKKWFSKVWLTLPELSKSAGDSKCIVSALLEPILIDSERDDFDSLDQRCTTFLLLAAALRLFWWIQPPVSSRYFYILQCFCSASTHEA